MKRDERIRGLSRDHHHALVLARFIAAVGARRALDGAAIALVKERFATEIVPHFVVEEILLTALEGHGVDDLVQRTREDHATMVELLASVTESSRSSMHPVGYHAACHALGALLADHVRFEERELYPACEAKLPAEVLDRVCAALEARKPGSPIS